MRGNVIESALLEIYRYVPPPLLEEFDPDKIDSIDELLGWLAKARYIEELEADLITRAIVAAFPED